MAPLDDLLAEIFGGRRGPLCYELEEWLRASRRFEAFVTAHRAKIRAKLKYARDTEGGLDVCAELEAAARLLREKSFTLEYERYAALRERGPDFTVTFKTHTPFNVEVRRVRGSELAEAGPEAQIAKLVAVLCDKVGQMPPAIRNVLWLTAENGIPEPSLAGATLLLRQLAERRVDNFFTQRGFEGAADFLRQYQRLNAVVLPQPEAVVWANPLARAKLPGEIVTGLRRVAS
jgi:hypothetical protein